MAPTEQAWTRIEPSFGADVGEDETLPQADVGDNRPFLGAVAGEDGTLPGSARGKHRTFLEADVGHQGGAPPGAELCYGWVGKGGRAPVPP